MTSTIESARISGLLDQHMPSDPDAVVFVLYSDGAKGTLFTFTRFDYDDGEVPFREADFLGLTAEEARARYAPEVLSPEEECPYQVVVGSEPANGRREDYDEGEIPY